MQRMPPAVLALLIINIVAFAAGYLLPGGPEQLDALGALWYPANSHFGPWQIVSYMFLHGGFSHIFFNMFALVSFGTLLEREWGTGRFVLFYFLCGIGAALIQLGVNWQEYRTLYAHLTAGGLSPSAIDTMLASGRGELPASPTLRAELIALYGIYAGPMVGASGAIYGLLVAFGCMHPNAKLALMFIPVPVAAKYFIPGLLLLDLLSGLTGFSLFGGNIAHFAHLGGAAIGFLLMLLWRHRHQPPVWTARPTGV